MISNVTYTVLDTYGGLMYASANGIYFGWNQETQRAGWRASCRMEAGWQHAKTSSRYIGFCAPTLDIPLIDAIWSNIESSMGLTERTIIHRTDKPNVLLFELPAFWTANDTANGMLTLFMRAVCVYGDTDLTKMFKAYDRTARILKTVLWFTSGNIVTTYPALTVKDKDDYIGICAEYDGVSDEKLAAKLIKPPILTLALKT